MSTVEIQPQDVQDGVVIASEGHPECPEPCGCDESNAMRDLLECIIQYDSDVNPCDPEHCQGKCAFCQARVLLERLEEKRKLRR
jgi:hypothetical protein